MDNSSNTVLTTKVVPHLKFICCFNLCSRHLIYYVIKTTPSDADSREEQDGSKQKLIGGTTANLWPTLRQGVTKNMEEK